jgi:hypothetical protein
MGASLNGMLCFKANSWSMKQKLAAKSNRVEAMAFGCIELNFCYKNSTNSIRLYGTSAWNKL